MTTDVSKDLLKYVAFKQNWKQCKILTCTNRCELSILKNNSAEYWYFSQKSTIAKKTLVF